MSQDLFSSDSVDDPASQSTPVTSSGLSDGSSSAASAVPNPVLNVPVIGKNPLPSKSKKAQPAPGIGYVCQHCGKGYIRKWYYERHVIAHEISDVNTSVPNTAQFHIVTKELMIKVIEVMKTEHDLGEDSTMKTIFLGGISLETVEGPEWSEFLKRLEEPLLKFLTEPSKLLPQNKYGEALKKLNFYFGEPSNTEVLMNCFKNVAPDFFPLFESLAQRLIIRMTFLLLRQIQVFIAQEMLRNVTSSAVVESVQEVDKADKSAEFYIVLGNLLRSLFTNAHKRKNSSKMFQSLCSCLKQKFVSYVGVDEPITSKQFSDKNLWLLPEEFDGHEGIMIEREVVEFFSFVEESITLDNNVFCSCEDLMPKIYSNRGIMSVWCALTNSYFGDANAVCIMKKVVAAFRELYIVNEMGLKNRQHTASKHALRTNLKRD